MPRRSRRVSHPCRFTCSALAYQCRRCRRWTKVYNAGVGHIIEGVRGVVECSMAFDMALYMLCLACYTQAKAAVKS